MVNNETNTVTLTKSAYDCMRSTNDRTYDFCPDCMREFEDFLKGESYESD